MSKSKSQWSNTVMPKRSMITKQSIKMILQLFVLCISCLVIQTEIIAQHPTADPDNYFTMMAEYDLYLSNNPTDTSEDGFEKNYNTWKWYWEGRASSGDSTNVGSFETYLEMVGYMELGPLCQNPTSQQLEWEQLGPNSTIQLRQGRVDIINPSPTNPNNLYVGTPSSGIWRCADISATVPSWYNITDQLNFPSMSALALDIEGHGHIALASLGYRIGVSKTKSFSIGLYKTDEIEDVIPSWTRVLPYDDDDYTSKITKVHFDKFSPNIAYAIMNNQIHKSYDTGSTWDTLVDAQFDTSPDQLPIKIYDFILGKEDHEVLYVLGETKYLNDDADAWLGEAYLWKADATSGVLGNNIVDDFEASGDTIIRQASFRRLMMIDEGEQGIYILYKNSDLSGDTVYTIRHDFLPSNFWGIHIVNPQSSVNQLSVFDVSDINDSVYYYEGGGTGRQLIKYINGAHMVGTNYNPNTLYNGVSTHADIRAIHVDNGGTNGEQDRIYLGCDGGILYSESTGSTYINWTPINGEGLAITQFFGGGQQYDAIDIYGGGCQDNGIMVHRGNGTWEHEHGGDGYELIFEKEDSDFALSENNFGVYSRSTNNANTFSGTLPDDRFAGTDSLDNEDGCQNSMMKQPVYNDMSGNYFVGYHNVHRNNDHGDLNTWETISDFSGSGNELNIPGNWQIEDMAVYKPNNNTIYVAYPSPTWTKDQDLLTDECFSQAGPACTSCDVTKRLFRTNNALNEDSATVTWEDITPNWVLDQNNLPKKMLWWKGISSIAISDKDSNHVWLAFNYKGGSYNNGEEALANGEFRVIKTTNPSDVNSWEDYSDNLPVFPVTELMYLDGSNNGVFCGTDLGIYYTDDDIYPTYGWLCVNKQLPPVIISDIDINYCTNEVMISTFGRGIYKADLSDLGVDLDIEITEDTWWNSTMEIAGDVTITNGAVLTISSEIRMGQMKKITIDVGSELIIDGGELTGGCGDLWDGVYVRGDKNASQDDNANQGKITMINDAVISNAYTAIRNHGLKANGSTDWGSTGGIIRATNSTFYNNRWDVTYKSYQWPQNTNSPSSYNSIFIDCNFVVDDQAHGGGVSRVNMYKVYGIGFKDCRFEDNRTDLEPFEKGYGINSMSGNFSIENSDIGNPNNSYFRNFKYGIYSNTLTYSAYSIDITGMHFDCFKGVYLLDISNPRITNNTFNVTPSFGSTGADFDSPYGLYLDFSRSYTVQENHFISSYSDFAPIEPYIKCIGLVIKNDDRNSEEIRRNVFENFHIGTEAIGLNRNPANYDGLEFLCNEFLENRHDIYVTQDFSNPVDPVGIAQLQGEMNFPSGVTDPAGNIFTDPIFYPSNYKFQNTNGFSGGLGDLVYYIHNITASAPNLVPNPYLNIQPIEIGIPYNQMSSCESLFLMMMESPEDEIVALSLKTEETLTELNALTVEYNSLVDGGNTSQLTSDIALTTDANAWTHYQTLMENAGYLSDDVLEEISAKEDGFNDAMIRNVLTENPQSAKSTEVQTILDNRANQLPQYMRDQIDLGLTQISPKEYLEMTMSTLKKTHDRALNEMVLLMKRDTVVDRSLEIVTALSETNNILFDYKLVEYYDEVNNQELGDALLQVMDSYTLTDSEQSFHTNYTDYRSLINQWKNDDVEFSNLDSVKLTQLNFYAELNNTIAGEAISLQKLNGSSEYNEPSYFPTPSEKSYSPDEAKKITIKDNSLNLFPNPSVDYFTVDYKLAETFEKGIIVVVDMKGNVVYSVEISNDRDQFIIPTKDLASGTYNCSIIIDGNSISTKNVTIVK